MNLKRISQKLFTRERTLALSFALFILTGTFCLMLPQATQYPPLNFIEALFTATSATCVTGLVIVDTGTKFTLMGQIIILIMIQLGGLGIITFSTAFLYIFEGRLSIGSHDILTETLSQGPFPDIRKLLKTVFLSTIAIETIGSILLTLRFIMDMPILKAIYYGIFHAVSAFCNAGFGLFTDSLLRYRDDLIVNFTISSLIILGGLGFIVLYEFLHFKNLAVKKLSLHSRIVLVMTICMIIGGMFMFFMLENKNVLYGLPFKTKLFASFFQSVTARTAGFNTIDLSLLSNPCLFVLIILMFIGAAPASCSGGIKITTLAILLAFIKARFNNQEDVNLHNRRVPPDSVSKAISIAVFSFLSIVICLTLLLITELAGISHNESRGLFLELLFEIISAFATVGLSTGTTPNLSAAGCVIITAMMFIGRLGPLTIAMTVGRKQKIYYKFAQENILVG